MVLVDVMQCGDSVDGLRHSKHSGWPGNESPLYWAVAALCDEFAAICIDFVAHHAVDVFFHANPLMVVTIIEMNMCVALCDALRLVEDVKLDVHTFLRKDTVRCMGSLDCVWLCPVEISIGKDKSFWVPFARHASQGIVMKLTVPFIVIHTCQTVQEVITKLLTTVSFYVAALGYI